MEQAGYQGFSMIGAVNLYGHNAASVVAATEHTPIDVVRERFRAKVRSLDPLTRGEHMKREGLRIIADHPDRTAGWRGRVLRAAVGRAARLQPVPRPHHACRLRADGRRDVWVRRPLVAPCEKMDRSVTACEREN